MKCLTWETVLISTKRFNYHLYIALVLRACTVTTYQTVRVFILGSLPSDWGVSIASQLQWVNVMYEVLQEFLLLPLFHCLGSSVRDRDDLVNKFKTGLIVVVTSFTAAGIVLAAAADPLVRAMAQQEDTVDATVVYVRLETIGIALANTSTFLIILLVVSSRVTHLYISLIIEMVTNITMDVFLVSTLPVSAQLGVNGVAYSSMITGAAKVIYGLVAVCLSFKVRPSDIFREVYEFKWITHYASVGIFSGIESFLRNAVYLVVVLRTMNQLSEQGTYWVANTFIWSWVLLLSNPLADVAKQDIGTIEVSRPLSGSLCPPCYQTNILGQPHSSSSPQGERVSDESVEVSCVDEMEGQHQIDPMSGNEIVVRVESKTQSGSHDGGNQEETASPVILTHLVVMTFYFLFVSFIVVTQLLSIPGWLPFITHVLNGDDPTTSTKLCYILYPFYILYMYNTIMDSVFYGKGRTSYMLAQAVITQIVIVCLFTLLLTGVVKTTLESVSIVFGTGIAVDTAVTIGLYWYYMKKIQWRFD
eukprot:GHVN01017237.1.p1 GENE.GHVN01017237.1~~GHVN01017237.1.p1  ORF type:complete len:531 (-),score=82.95 GHVN01017237.1:350-1942(-)